MGKSLELPAKEAPERCKRSTVSHSGRSVGEQNAERNMDRDGGVQEVAEDPTETCTGGQACQILVMNLASVCLFPRILSEDE